MSTDRIRGRNPWSDPCYFCGQPLNGVGVPHLVSSASPGHPHPRIAGVHPECAKKEAEVADWKPLPLLDGAPILTQAEVVQDLMTLAEMDAKFGGSVKVDAYIRRATATLNTITQFEKLLREPCTCSDGNNTHRDSMGAWICESCHRKEVTLARYDGEKTKS